MPNLLRSDGRVERGGYRQTDRQTKGRCNFIIVDYVMPQFELHNVFFMCQRGKQVRGRGSACIQLHVPVSVHVSVCLCALNKYMITTVYLNFRNVLCWIRTCGM